MDASTRISYSEFGHNFIRHVVTAERIRGEIEGVLQSAIEGSVRRFPADMLVAAYRFELRDVAVHPLLQRLPEVSFGLELGGDMALDVKLLNLQLNLTLDVRINIQIDVHTHAPLTLKLIVHEVTGSDIRIDIDGHGLPSEVLERLRIVGPIVREVIVREVNERVRSPDIATSTVIDVLKLVASVQPATPARDEGAEDGPLAGVTGHSAGDEGLARELANARRVI